MAEEMAQNPLRELLAEFQGRLNERFAQVVVRMDEGFTRVDQRLDGLSTGQHSLEAVIASMDTRLSARISELSHSMAVLFEKSHANMKLGFGAVGDLPYAIPSRDRRLRRGAV